jgi:hypothetical protein
MVTGTLGPTAAGMPWRKLAVALAAVVVLGVPFGFGVADAITKDRQDRNAEHRSHCVAVPEAVRLVGIAGLADLDGRTTPGWGMVQQHEGAHAGSWFVSAELVRPTAPRDSIGDIATWIAPDDGTGAAPAASGWQAVDGHARAFSSWPDAPAGLHVSEDGGIESRFCAIDVTRDPLR